ncbi:MAG: hypothetical protein COV75_05565 [Candidatus Omnitrophica bacterium CG11_big_fil_rev_8_21_14_0_20_63_9]|nr:MAG: hypothetical protein COV75_05565 [Candidatus Omnitrophica bacterium CG11_big_fil_rev_8_21_14_0_20_63_9]
MAKRGWVKTLATELDAWVADGVISREQGERIRARYGGQAEYNRLSSSILILGAILVGLGIILFITSNWQALGQIAKVGLIAAAIVAFNAVGYRWRERPGASPRVGEAFLLLGAIVYGAGIWLVAQIFQFPYNHADSVLAWIVGILPVVWLMRTWSVLVLASFLAPVWLIVLMADPSHQGIFSYLFLSNPTTSAFYRYLPLAALVGAFAYRERNWTALTMTLLGLAIWLGRFGWVHLESQGLPELSAQLQISALFATYGLALYALGMAHRDEAMGRFAQVYRILALVFLFVGNFSLTFAHHHTGAVGNITFTPVSLLAYAGLAGSAWGVNRWLGALRAGSSNEPTLLLMMIACQFIGMHLAPAGSILVSIWFNLLLIGELLAFLYLSYRLRDEKLFRLALYGFAFEILGRYFDTFWTLLPRSFSFLVGGAVLIAGGIIMERKRKALFHQPPEARS